MTGPSCGHVLTVAGVELMLRAGRDLQEIEAEILASDELDEEAQAALWLYGWCCQEHMSRSGSRCRGWELQATPRLGHRSVRKRSGRARLSALTAVAGCGEPPGRIVSTGRSGSGR